MNTNRIEVIGNIDDKHRLIIVQEVMREPEEVKIITLLYMQMVLRLFSEQENIFALYLINLFYLISTSVNTDKIYEILIFSKLICGEKALNTSKTSEFCNGLYYFNARWYDPMLGRFTTEDPIRDGINWFVYASNNPLRFVDPSGLIAVIESDIVQNTDTGEIFSNETGSINDEVTLTVSRGEGSSGAFPDSMTLDVHGVQLAQVDVESSPTRVTKELDDFELPAGDDYKAELSASSPFYKNSFLITSETAQGPLPLKPGVTKNMYFRIHPDTITKKNSFPNKPVGQTYNPPISDGCSIPALKDFNRLWNITLQTGLNIGDSVDFRIED